jgi:O-acetylserine/cysteine efflux transporter
LTLFSTASLGKQTMNASAIGATISRLVGLERSAIQIVCAVAVPLLWGYQFVAVRVGVTEFPPFFFLALRFLAIALLLVPFIKKPTRRGAFAARNLPYFNRVLEHQPFLAGDTFSMPDITLYAFRLFADLLNFPVAPDFKALAAWRARVEELPAVRNRSGKEFLAEDLARLTA